MEMRVVETGNDASSARVDEAGIPGAQAHDLGLAAHRDDPFAPNGECCHLGPAALQRRRLGIVHDQVRRRFGR